MADTNPPDVNMPIAAVELQEYLLAGGLMAVAHHCEATKHNVTDWDNLRDAARKSFRFQRFAVMNWLMMNGVAIPPHLLADQTHPPVGQQYPDHPVKSGGMINVEAFMRP